MAGTLNKDNPVTFINTSSEVKKLIASQCKAALRASGKVVRKLLRERIPIRSNRFKNHIGTWVYVDKATGQPQMQVGFYSHARVVKKGKKASHASPNWIEFGTQAHEITSDKPMGPGGIYGRRVHHPGQKATHVLRDTVANNIDDIRSAQAEYLQQINDTMVAAGLEQFADLYDEEEEDD